jgi:hypothetical protein
MEQAVQLDDVLIWQFERAYHRESLGDVGHLRGFAR